MFFRHLHQATLENCSLTYNKYFLHSWGEKNTEVQKRSQGEQSIGLSFFRLLLCNFGFAPVSNQTNHCGK